jgi:hypothetical protein
MCRTKELFCTNTRARWQTGGMQKNRRFITLLAALAVSLMAAAGGASAQAPETGSASAAPLLEKYTELAPKLAQNVYRRPLFLESSETAEHASSTAYAVLDAPFSTVSATFKQPGHWCDILILHLNTKYCHADAQASPASLTVNIGQKTPQRLAETSVLAFSYRVTDAAADHLAVQLHADTGPLNTRNYRMELEVVPLAQGKTFISLRYSYDYGLPGRMAMQAYLSTTGRGKVGFTQTPEGYIGGIRGIIERNTMRYYLAIEAYMASLRLPPEQQSAARLRHWFDATEGYSRQLHELDKASYLTMKEAEYQRQQLPPSAAE